MKWGSKSAKIYGDAHEYGQVNMEATNMDLVNNEIGRQIGELYKKNENIAKKNGYCTLAFMVPVCGESYQSFGYLGKTFTASNYSSSYDVMSSMVSHAIDKGVLTVLIP